MTKQRVDLLPALGMDVQIGLLLAVLDDTTKEWREELGEVADEVISWQPVPGGHNIGALLLHIADVEAHWIDEVGAGRPRSQEELKTLLSEETDQYAVRWPVPPARPLSWFLAEQDKVRAHTRATVANLNDPEHLGTRAETDFTLRWLLNHVISHEAYHGGQAVLLSLLHKGGKR